MKRSEYERTLTAQVCGKELYLEQTVTLIESTFANRNGETKKLKQCRIVFLDSHRAARTRRHDIFRGRRLADSRSQNVQRRQFNQRVGVALPTLAHSSGDAPVFMQTICIYIVSVLLIAFPLLSVLCKQFQEAERKRFKKERLKDLLLEIKTSPGQHHKVIGKLLCMKKIS